MYTWKRFCPGLRLVAVACIAAGWLSIRTAARAAEEGTRVEDFNLNWRFAQGEQPEAAGLVYDDSDWQAVRLPHDWAISGPYDPEASAHTGKLPWQGEGWYRKRFRLAEADRGRRVYLDLTVSWPCPAFMSTAARPAAGTTATCPSGWTPPISSPSARRTWSRYRWTPGRITLAGIPERVSTARCAWSSRSRSTLRTGVYRSPPRRLRRPRSRFVSRPS